MRRRDPALEVESVPCGSVRDTYGFEVKQEFQQLYNKYSPLWEKEEIERGERWRAFLSLTGAKIRVHGDGHWVFEDKAGNPIELHETLKKVMMEVRRGNDAKQRDMAGEWHLQLRCLVQAGIPMFLRGELWRLFLDIGSRKVKGYYWLLATRKSREAEENNSCGAENFSSFHGLRSTNEEEQIELVKKVSHAAADESPALFSDNCDWESQIEKDLHRTFPGHPLMDRNGREALRRILGAYSHHKQEIGYCQGMNFIAGLLLLFMDEEDAFWCLSCIVEDLLPGHFHLEMVAPVVDQMVFRHMVEQHFPRLSAHLEGLGVDITYMCTQWFLCCFVNALPLETCLRVWDLLFLERCSCIMFRVALGLVDIYSKALIQTVDALDAWELLQTMAPMSFDGSRLINVACIGFSNITPEYVESLREIYRERVANQTSPQANDAVNDEEGGEISRSSMDVGASSTEGAASNPIPAFWWAAQKGRGELGGNDSAPDATPPTDDQSLRSRYRHPSDVEDGVKDLNGKTATTLRNESHKTNLDSPENEDNPSDISALETTSSAVAKALEIASKPQKSLGKPEASLASLPVHTQETDGGNSLRNSPSVSQNGEGLPDVGERGRIKRVVEEALEFLQDVQESQTQYASARTSWSGSQQGDDLGLRALFDSADTYRFHSNHPANRSDREGERKTRGYDKVMSELVQLVVSLESRLVESEKRQHDYEQRSGDLAQTVGVLKRRLGQALQDCKEREDFLAMLVVKNQKLTETLAQHDQKLCEQQHIIAVQQQELQALSQKSATKFKKGRAPSGLPPRGKMGHIARFKDILQRKGS